MRKAVMIVSARNIPGEPGAQIQLYYSYTGTNTWYTPQKAKIGAETGTWYVSRGMNFIQLFDGSGQEVAFANCGFSVNWVGYPFEEEHKNQWGGVTFSVRSAVFYTNKYMEYAVPETPDTQWFLAIV